MLIASIAKAERIFWPDTATCKWRAEQSHLALSPINNDINHHDIGLKTQQMHLTCIIPSVPSSSSNVSKVHWYYVCLTHYLTYLLNHLLIYLLSKQTCQRRNYTRRLVSKGFSKVQLKAASHCRKYSTQSADLGCCQCIEKCDLTQAFNMHRPQHKQGARISVHQTLSTVNIKYYTANDWPKAASCFCRESRSWIRALSRATVSDMWLRLSDTDTLSGSSARNCRPQSLWSQWYGRPHSCHGDASSPLFVNSSSLQPTTTSCICKYHRHPLSTHRAYSPPRYAYANMCENVNTSSISSVNWCITTTAV